MKAAPSQIHDDKTSQTAELASFRPGCVSKTFRADVIEKAKRCFAMRWPAVRPSATNRRPGC